MALPLRNPHSVLAVLQTRPQDVIGITLPTKSAGGLGEGWDKVVELARQKRVPVNSGSAGGGGKTLAADESLRQGLAEASVKERMPVAIEDLFRDASSRAGGHGLWIALDSLQDPHNVGAIFRTAAFFGVQGILLTQDRSASLTATVYDVASGGMEAVPFSIHTNLQRAFEVAKEMGLWILGTSEHAHDDFMSIQRDRPWLLVLGNEEKGMRRLTEERCDVLCTVPGKGKVTSLNVSVAAGVLVSHLAR